MNVESVLTGEGQLRKVPQYRYIQYWTVVMNKNKHILDYYAHAMHLLHV